MRRKRLSKEVLEQAAVLYLTQDISMKNAAKMFGFSLNALSKYLKKTNRKSKRVLSEDQLEEAISIYLCNDISAKNIGFIFGVSEGVILDKIRILGLNKNLPEFYNNIEQAIQYYTLNNLSVEKVCEIFNVPKTTLRRHLSDRQLKKPVQKRWKKQLSNEELEELYSVYLCNDINNKDISYIFGISVEYFLKQIEIAGLIQDERRCTRKIEISEYQSITNEYKKTKSIVQLAQKYNVSASSIEKILKKHNIKLVSRKEKRILNDNQEKEIVDRYLSGESITSISKDFPMIPSGLSRCLERNGIKPTRKTGLEHLTEEDILSIVELYKDDTIFIRDIRSRFKISYRALEKILKKYNIENRGFKSLYSDGIAGFYKGRSFRSLNELCFMGKELETKFTDNEWRSGENKNDRIRYTDKDGKERWYYPDFVIRNKTVIEIKPVHLFGDANVICKSLAAKKFCEENGKGFLIINFKIDINFIIQELNSGNIKMTEKNLERLKKKYLNKGHIALIESSHLNLC